MPRHNITAVISALAVLIVFALSSHSPVLPESSQGGSDNVASMSEPLSLDPLFYDEDSGIDETRAGTASAPARDERQTRPEIRPANHISAAAYLVGDIESGQIYLERNIEKTMPVASMSKLITAIVSMDMLRSGDTVEIPLTGPDVSPDTSKIRAGEKFPMNEVLYPLLLNSSNIAAEALASTSGRASFMEAMSSYAWEIGMNSTYFADPSGLSPLNVSSAKDFFALARYLYASRPDILAITRTQNVSSASTTDHESHEYTNIHPFAADPDFIGGKTGHTSQAKDTMLTMMRVKDKLVAIVVLSSDDRRRDTELLLGLVKKALAR